MATRIEICHALREKGLTYEEIGDIFGISKQAVHEALNKPRDGFRETTVRRVKYVGLRNWMLNNRVSLAELERRCGDSCRMRRSLVGPYEPSKRNIDAILKITGLTYEECFKEVTYDQN